MDFDSLWTAVLQEVDKRIAAALVRIGVIGSSINAETVAGNLNTTTTFHGSTWDSLMADADGYVMMDADGNVMRES